MYSRHSSNRQPTHASEFINTVVRHAHLNFHQHKWSWALVSLHVSTSQVNLQILLTSVVSTCKFVYEYLCVCLQLHTLIFLSSMLMSIFYSYVSNASLACTAQARVGCLFVILCITWVACVQCVLSSYRIFIIRDERKTFAIVDFLWLEELVKALLTSCNLIFK